MKALAFYEVEWIDSESDNGWDHPDKVKHPQNTVVSYGFFVKQSDIYFTIAGDYDPDNYHFNRFIHIPKVNIKKKRKIKL